MVAAPFRGRADAGQKRLSGDGSAAGELYETHGRRIYMFCLGRLRNPHEAEDATQQTFLNAFRGLQRGVAPDHEAAWLYKIAENVCLTRQRSSSRRRRVEAPEDLDALQDVLPSAALDADELFHLPEALQAMPEQQRRALLLREWQGLSYHEIAEELCLSHSAVEALLFRARRSLAAGLDDEERRSKKGIARRLRAGGDAGSVFALIKTLLFSGGAKVLIAGATVAATSVVAATPSVRHAVEHVIAPPPATHVEHHVSTVSGARRGHSVPVFVGRPGAATRPPSHAAAAVHRWRHGRHLGSVRRASPNVSSVVVPHGRAVAATHAHSAVKPKQAPVRSQRTHAAVSASSSSNGKAHQSMTIKPAAPVESSTPPGQAKKSSTESAPATLNPKAHHAPNGVVNGNGSDNGQSGAAHGKSSHS